MINRSVTRLNPLLADLAGSSVTPKKFSQCDCMVAFDSQHPSSVSLPETDLGGAVSLSDIFECSVDFAAVLAVFVESILGGIGRVVVAFIFIFLTAYALLHFFFLRTVILG